MKFCKNMLAALSVLFCTAAFADGSQTCKVKGTDGSVEVSVNVTDAQTGTCVIYFSNDTDKNVNVRYTVVGDEGTRIPGAKLVYANSEATKQISFGKPVRAHTVKVETLTGEKCN